MTSGIRTVIYPVKDQAQAKTLYGRLLGVEPDMDEPYYVGFSVEGQHIGLDPHGHSKTARACRGRSATGTSTTSRRV